MKGNNGHLSTSIVIYTDSLDSPKIVIHLTIGELSGHHSNEEKVSML